MNHEHSIATLLGSTQRSCLLTAPEERVKSDLGNLATNILTMISEIVTRETDVMSSVDITTCFNLAALAHYHYGDIHRAETLCAAAVKLCLDRYDSTRDVEWLAALLQPYANIGRLRAIGGRTDDALAQFRSMFLFVRGVESLRVEGEVLDATLGSQVQERDPYSLRISENSYVGDSIRACLLNENFSVLENFLSCCRNDGLDKTQASRFVLEGELRCNLAFKALRPALDKAVELWNLCKKDSPPDPSVLALLCDIYIAANQIQAAHSVVDKMLSYCEMLRGTQKTQRSLKRAFYVLSLRYLNCGDKRAAAAAISNSLELARRLADESLEIRLACIGHELWSQDHSLFSENETFNDAFLSRLAAGSLHRLDQLLACIELGIRSEAPGGNLMWVAKVKQLIQYVGFADANKIRELYPDLFLSCPDSNARYSESPVNLCPAMNETYETLVRYVNICVRP
jgi:hypothetical protein